MELINAFSLDHVEIRYAKPNSHNREHRNADASRGGFTPRNRIMHEREMGIEMPSL